MECFDLDATNPIVGWDICHAHGSVSTDSITVSTIPSEPARTTLNDAFPLHLGLVSANLCADAPGVASPPGRYSDATPVSPSHHAVAHDSRLIVFRRIQNSYYSAYHTVYKTSSVLGPRPSILIGFIKAYAALCSVLTQQGTVDLQSIVCDVSFVALGARNGCRRNVYMHFDSNSDYGLQDRT